MLAFSKRLLRAARYATSDNRIPRSLRLFAAVGLIPVPGPTDLVLLIVAVPFGLFYREPLADAWRRSRVGQQPSDRPDSCSCPHGGRSDQV